MKPMEYGADRKLEILATGKYRGVSYWVMSMGSHPTAYIETTGLNTDRIAFDCHGGVTYEEDHLQNVWDEANEDFEKGKRSFIGWDYAHSGDYMQLAMVPSLGYLKYTTEEIVEDCRHTIYDMLKQIEKRNNKRHSRNSNSQRSRSSRRSSTSSQQRNHFERS